MNGALEWKVHVLPDGLIFTGSMSLNLAIACSGVERLHLALISCDSLCPW